MMKMENPSKLVFVKDGKISLSIPKDFDVKIFDLQITTDSISLVPTNIEPKLENLKESGFYEKARNILSSDSQLELQILKLDLDIAEELTPQNLGSIYRRAERGTEIPQPKPSQHPDFTLRSTPPPTDLPP